MATNISKIRVNDEVISIKDQAARTAIGTDGSGNLVSIADNIKDNAVNADYSEGISIKDKIESLEVASTVYFESGTAPVHLTNGGLFFEQQEDESYKPQIKESDTTLKDVLFDSAVITNLKTVNGSNIRGTGDIEFPQVLPEKPTFEPTKQFVLGWVLDEAGTGYELKWTTFEELDPYEDADEKEYSYE